MSKRIKLICQICGNEFETWENWALKSGGKYCSHSCSAKSRTGAKNPKYNGVVSWTCKMCGEINVTCPSKVRVFCSLKCKGEWQSIYVTGINHHNYREAEAVCEICKNIFKFKPSNKRRFCSIKCRDIWCGEQFKKKIVPDLDRLYPLVFNKEFKTMIRQRDGFTCLLCKKNGFDVHHIDYDKFNTTPENCVTLCRVCHPKTNHNREYWQQEIRRLLNEQI